MNPWNAAAIGAGSAVVLLLLILLVVDQFVAELPSVRKARGWLVGGVGVVLALLTFGLLRKKSPKPDPKPAKPEPKEFDDAPIIENKQAAADLDVDAAGDAAGEPSLDDLQSELDKL